MGSLNERPCSNVDNDVLGSALNNALQKARDQLKPVRIFGIRGSVDALTAGSRFSPGREGGEISGPLDAELLMLRIEHLDGHILALVVAGAFSMDSGAVWPQLENTLRSRIAGAGDALLFVAPPSKRSLSWWGNSRSSSKDAYSHYLNGVAGRWAEVARFGLREELKDLFVKLNSATAKIANLGSWVVLNVPFEVNPSVSLYLKERVRGVPVLILGDSVSPGDADGPNAGQVHMAEDRWIPKVVANVGGAISFTLGKRIEKFHRPARTAGEASWDFETYDFTDRWRPAWRAEIRAPAMIDGGGRGGGKSLLLNGGSLEIVKERAQKYERSPEGSITFWLRVVRSKNDDALSEGVQLLEGNGINVKVGTHDGALYFQGRNTGTKLAENAWNHVGITTGRNERSLYLNGMLTAQTRVVQDVLNWTIGGKGALRIDDLVVWNHELGRREILESFRSLSVERKEKLLTVPFPGDNPFPMQPTDPDYVSHASP
jgi:hypothetical protein